MVQCVLFTADASLAPCKKPLAGAELHIEAYFLSSDTKLGYDSIREIFETGYRFSAEHPARVTT